MTFRLPALILIGVLMPCVIQSAGEEQRLKVLGEKVKQVHVQKEGVEKSLKAIDERSWRIRLDIQKRQAGLDARKAQMRQHQAMIRTYEVSLGKTRNHLRKKIAGLYKGSSLDIVDMVLGHEEMTGYLLAAVANDHESIQYYQRVSRLKKQAAQHIAAQTHAMKQDLAYLESRNHELGNEAALKKTLLASLMQESAVYQNEIEQLMERLRKQAEADAQTGKSRQADTEIAQRKGKLPWPLKGEVTRRFGRYKQGDSVQISQGIDIKTAEGTEVKCVYKGRIAYTGWIENFGNTVIVDHGGGYFSIYGRINKPLKKQGDEVDMSETIAQLGRGAEGASLHFEIRSAGKAQDPGLWLKK